jgi:hypothetical protein
MPFLYIEEYVTSAATARGLIPAAQQPPIATQKIDFTAGEAKSAAFNPQTRFVRIHCDAVCSFVFGNNPTATAASARMPANQTEYFGIDSHVTNKVSVIGNT